MKYLDIRIDDIVYVRALRAKLLEMLLEGKQIVEFSSEGTSVRKTTLVPIDVLLDETRQFILSSTGSYPVDTANVWFV